MLGSLRSLLLLLLLLFVTYASTQSNVIVSGATWTDTSGNVIQAHGAGILKVRVLHFRRGRDIF